MRKARYGGKPGGSVDGSMFTVLGRVEMEGMGRARGEKGRGVRAPRRRMRTRILTRQPPNLRTRACRLGKRSAHADHALRRHARKLPLTTRL